MFERPHHQRIAQLLLSLNGKLLGDSHCYFGGGTAIALRFGEYRESVDVDFAISDPDHYRDVRQMIRNASNLTPLMREDIDAFPLEREIRVDQYGIRTMVNVAGVAVKFEIIYEARITLDEPGEDDMLCGVPTLSVIDMAATKLLANSDRGLDGSVMSRDVIDLAMMKLDLQTLRKAIAKAETAYGEAILQDLEKSIYWLQQKEGLLEHCMKAMSINVPRGVLWNNLQKLNRVV